MDLLPLAIAAVDDRHSQAVLGDAVLESGWSDERVTWMLRTTVRWKWEFAWDALHLRSKVRSQARARNLSRKHARRPTRRWCRAVLAALLFGEWNQEMWPAMVRSQIVLTGLAAMWDAEMTEAMKRLQRQMNLQLFGGVATVAPGLVTYTPKD